GCGRFHQVAAYFEKELGGRWPALPDRLAGGGAVLAVKLGPNPPPALLVIQGKDPALTQKFAQLGLQVIDQELARQDARDRPEKGTYRGVETAHIGKDFHAAVAGSALLLSNTEQGLQMGLDMHVDPQQKSLAGVKSVAEARKLLPPKPLAWTWVNLETVRHIPGAEDAFTFPRKSANLTVQLGGILDLVGR